MICPRCKTRCVKDVGRWYCFNHGEILTSEEQAELDRFRQINTEKAGDTRRFRGSSDNRTLNGVILATTADPTSLGSTGQCAGLG